jgi:hypothetical protein
MATKCQFEAELAKHSGAALDLDCADCDYYVDAPKGFVWRSTGTHTLTAPHANESGDSFKPQAYGDLIADMKDGLEPCDTPDCDVCAER